MIKKPAVVLCAALASATALTVYGGAQQLIDSAPSPAPSPTPEPAPAERTVVSDQDDIEASITFRTVGDILIHDQVYEDAARRAGGNGFDFAPMLAPVKRYLENADITTANMEVPVAGPEFELSGYPAFNSPPEVIDALKGAGVDLVNNATNHSLDRGTAGLRASISNMRERDMPYVGGYASPEDRSTARILERNGLKVGYLSYTYGTNGIPIPVGEEYAVNLIDPEMMRRDIADLRNRVDILIVILHAGEEYEPLPIDAQINAVDIAREAGADFIQGGHPHVLQPFTRFNDSSGAGAWFSHGNFLHDQFDERTKVGGIGEYTLTKHRDGAVTVDSIRFMPTYAVGGPHFDQHKVIPLAGAAPLGVIDVDATMAEVKALMNTYTDVEVVDYLDEN